jgi:hypothetical protein
MRPTCNSNHHTLYPCLTGGKLNVKKGMNVAEALAFKNPTFPGLFHRRTTRNIPLDICMQILHTQMAGPESDILFPHSALQASHLHSLPREVFLNLLWRWGVFKEPQNCLLTNERESNRFIINHNTAIPTFIIYYEYLKYVST